MPQEQNKEYSDLKKRAMLAKQRLKMGYWQALSEEKVKALGENGNNYETLKRVKDLQKAKMERENNKNLGSALAIREEQMYEKVSKILDNDEDVTNPIGLLVDHTVFDKLDEANKQRYILELSNSFVRLRERYYKERCNPAYKKTM